MGGSSLAPEVIRLSFGDQDGWSRRCTCSTRPTRARSARSSDRDRPRHDPVPRLDQVGRDDRDAVAVQVLLGAAARGPRSSSRSPTRAPASRTLASEHGFRRTFLNDPDIGGRYSALSYFGLVPAALMGADVARPPRPRRRRRAELPDVRRLRTRTAASGSAWRGASSRSPAATSSPTSSTRRSRASASGSSSSSPSRPARTARASSRSPTSRSASPRPTATTARFLYLRHVDEPEPRARREGRRAREGRPPGDHPHDPRPDRPRAAVLLRRVRDRGRRLGARASTRSTSPTCRRPRTRRTRVLEEGLGDPPDADDDALRALLSGLGAAALLRRSWATSSRPRPSTPR